VSLTAPLPVGPAHRLEAFDCGKPMLNHWLMRHARQSQASGSARTFVSCDEDRVAGYYSLTVGQIDTLEAPERVRRGMGQYPIPLIILARLAVDLDYQGRGLGYSLLQDALKRALTVAQQTGIRAVLTHPIDSQAEAFYRRYGFESMPENNRQLIVLLKDARRLVRA